MAINYLNEIISIFLQRNVNELSDNDLCTIIKNNGKTCSIEDVRHVVQSLGSSLFQLQYNHENIFLVRIEPTIDICKDFLAGKCTFKMGGCNQLHLCRYFDHCNKKNCHFPHDFIHGNNRRIIEQSKCQNINPILLVRLIRLHKQLSRRLSKTSVVPPVISKTPDMASSVQPKPIQQVFERTKRIRSTRKSRGGRSNRVGNGDNITGSTFVSPVLDMNYQIDISFQSESITSHITIEKIIIFLRQQGLVVQKVFNSKEIGHFRQYTLEFQEKNVVDKLLGQSSILYQGIHIKFKRTNSLIEQKSFVLKSTINSKRGPITKEKFSLYIDFLTNHCLYKLTDLSSSLEQILLIQCNNIIDFNQVHRVQKSRRQLQGTDISLKQVYELERAIIESIHNPLSVEIIENIIEPVVHDVFTFTVQSSRTAFIEFIHADSLKQWLLITDTIQQKFDVNIKLDIKYVDEDDDIDDNKATSCSSSDKLSPKSNKNSILSQTTINLRRGWAMVANHPTFSIEYKNYIRSELGIEIEIHGNRVEIRRNSISSTLVRENISTLLTNRTHNFMGKFAFRSIGLQQVAEQLNILRAHSSTVAFCNTKDKNYMLATKQSNIKAIMQKLSPIKPIDKNPINSRSSVASTGHETTNNVDQKELSTFVIPPPLFNSISTDDKPIVSDEMITKSVALPFNTPAPVALFTNKTFECYLQTYFNKNFNAKLNIERSTDINSRSLVKIVGRESCIDQALNELLTLISLCRTKIFNETIDSGWMKITDAVRVIQHHFDVKNIKCVCQQQISPLSILVHHIDKEHIEFGINEQIIDTLCRKKLILVTCTSATFENERMALKTKIFQRDDYGKDICLFDEQKTISLFGLPEIVKNVQQLFEDKKVNSAPSVVKTESNKRETLSTSKLPVLKIENSPLSTKSTIHEKYNQINTQRIQTYSITFDVDEPGFEILVNHNFNQLLAIIESKCQLEKQIIQHQIQIQIPKAKVDYFDDNTLQIQEQENNSEHTNDPSTASVSSKFNWFQRLFQWSIPTVQPSTPVQQQNFTSLVQPILNANNIASVAIGNSKIIVCTGDLTKQMVDIIVVCSTSRVLCDAIILAAGYEIKNAFNQQSSYGTSAFETKGGNLPCKQIVFRSWICDKTQLQNLKQSIDTFITSVITYALHHNLTTIAFPSIGCGQLGFDPKLIAEYMIGETYRQLKILVHLQLIVSFVLLPEQQNVYDAFIDRLNKIQFIEDKPTSISFNKQTVRIKLTSSNNNQLIECQNKIKQLAQSCSLKLHITDKTDMADWSQDTIQKYYDYCLQKRVIPTLDIQNSILDLIGPKDAVSDVEKYFFQLTAEVLRNARIQVLSRGCIWSVEISSSKWEQYPYRINEIIENAQMKKLPHIEFLNEKSERCRIIFLSMEEEYQKRKRKVCRKRIDSSLPSYWDLSSGNFRRIVLSDSSKEYKDIYNRFNSTMKDNYLKIMKIERIQNERWYKQYAAHRDEFTQRYTQPDERLLFHGCNSTSADKIVHECFNRTYAGVNGVMYGQGVYFHEHAKYSNSYTRPGVSNERTMFLARVLIGKTCIGSSSMKVPPEGFDTTTDGKHIFVIYHDAGAYGEYIITYR
ncbi:unnamed protein product [Rotaria sordida]|uniref:Poly [ADP-ribose] polymerase n=1 Tax=Rotaria sordida TaxID=392033 RepID=A0A815THV3_9BILA|nr:unnamed protein product [Rotaria sordida]CAF1502230.1 unnamed protein product [Rotaria sordida]